MFKDATIKEALAPVAADSLIWMECDDCHVLVVTKDFHPSIAGLKRQSSIILPNIAFESKKEDGSSHQNIIGTRYIKISVYRYVLIPDR